jgi:hypothetical protein
MPTHAATADRDWNALSGLAGMGRGSQGVALKLERPFGALVAGLSSVLDCADGPLRAVREGFDISGGTVQGIVGAGNVSIASPRIGGARRQRKS